MFNTASLYSGASSSSRDSLLSNGRGLELPPTIRGSFLDRIKNEEFSERAMKELFALTLPEVRKALFTKNRIRETLIVFLAENNREFLLKLLNKFSRDHLFIVEALTFSSNEKEKCVDKIFKNRAIHESVAKNVTVFEQDRAIINILIEKSATDLDKSHYDSSYITFPYILSTLPSRLKKEVLMFKNKDGACTINEMADSLPGDLCDMMGEMANMFGLIGNLNLLIIKDKSGISVAEKIFEKRPLTFRAMFRSLTETEKISFLMFEDESGEPIAKKLIKISEESLLDILKSVIGRDDNKYLSFLEKHEDINRLQVEANRVLDVHIMGIERNPIFRRRFFLR